MIRIRNKIWLIVALLLAVCLSPTETGAHALGPNLVQLDITQESPLKYHILWKDPNHGGLEVKLPADCVNVNQSAAMNNSSNRLVKCAKSLNKRKIVVDGPNADSLDLMVRLIPANLDDEENIEVLIFRGANNIITMVEVPTAIEVARTYFLLGVEHIFAGIDHLLFVLGLLLILAGWRQLIFTITAFTVAHSITLALATLGVISIPQAPVEAVIALSILFLATEYAHQLKGVKGWTTRRPWLISFSVGLLHGLGFANALSELGLPHAQLPLALLTFNLGVEAGQLTFVACVLLLINLAVRCFKNIPSWTRTITVYGIGTIAAFWFWQRTFAIIS